MRRWSRPTAARFQTMTFDQWYSFSRGYEGTDVVSTVSFKIRVPKVILLLFFDRMPKKEVKFTRHNIFERDHNTCQYCGHKFDRKDLNLDHVIPARSRRRDVVGKHRLLLRAVQQPQGQPHAERGGPQAPPQAEAAQVAAHAPSPVQQGPRRFVEAFRRLGLLERRADGLVSLLPAIAKPGSVCCICVQEPAG